ncbi:MAG: hypothetical protein COB96_00505 [Planctomycetota bacterium]|jgi:hypothetical protein|nr:MAG: hypothetical protein COB96_00505 [Planctomycetota bacterium]
MKQVLRLSLGVLLIAGSATFVVPENASAWSTIGGNLGLSQRDFRIYDDFQDATCHDNTTVHPNWPQYTEIEMSAWKSGAEWGARPFGDGTGDGTQSTVGDGGANFNFLWAGNAGSTGGFNGNIISPIGGSSGGVLAYCETPISDGWRIRFYESWTWDDGPDNVSSARMDFQGVSTHELGHALGLGHSNNSSATMSAYISGNGVSDRSIAQDDINGIQQGIYGAMSSTMPRIDSLQGSLNSGGTCIIVGANFSSSGNEVWLNNNGTSANGADGDPVKVTGLASTNGGTQISFTIPTSGIEGGSIQVKSNASGNSALSEGHPFDLGGGQPGLNTIHLSGPTSVLPGYSALFDFTNAPANTAVYLLYSLSNTGSTIFGHSFDLGPWTVLKNTTSDANGVGSYSVPVPSAASGLSVYLELGCNDNGTIYDSNALYVTVL